MRGYAGVIVLVGDSVLMVREPDFYTREPHWTFPSGKIEPGETPEAAAVRELAEESGCFVNVDDLDLIAVTLVEHQGQPVSKSWTYTATTNDLTIRPDDPDGLVTDAQWFDRHDAIGHMSAVAQVPKREPAVRFLVTGDRKLRWTFEVLESSPAVPTFRWDDPIPLV